MTDCVVEAGMGRVLACYDNLEILHEIMPEFRNMKFLHRVTDVKKLFYAQ